MGLKGRILGLFLICFSINTTCLIGIAFLGRIQNEAALQKMTADLTCLRMVGSIERNFGNLIQAWKNILLRGSTVDNFRKYTDELDKIQKDINEQIEQLRKADAGKTFDATLTEFSVSLTEMMERYRTAQTAHLQPPHAFFPAQADAAVKGVDRNVLTGISKIVTLVQSQSAGNAEEAERMSRLTMLASGGISLSLGLLSFFVFSHFLNRITRSLSTVTERVARSSHEVASASTLIAQSSTELSSSVTEQASTMQEIVATIDQMSAMVIRNTESTQQSRTMAHESEKLSQSGRENVQQMMMAIHDISQSNEQLTLEWAQNNLEVTSILTVIEEIGQRTKVIHDIVFQTRLLSFNASVEAARAGEHGKGFAVVAAEVGQLAQMSGTAAKEISLLLEQSLTKVRSIVEQSKIKMDGLMETGKAKVDKGGRVAEDCGRALDQITLNVSQLTQAVAAIAVASDEQSRGIQEVTRAISQLEQVAQQNATVAEQASATGEELQLESDALQTLVNELLQIIGSERRKPAPRAEPGTDAEDEEGPTLRTAA